MVGGCNARRSPASPRSSPRTRGRHCHPRSGTGTRRMRNNTHTSHSNHSSSSMLEPCTHKWGNTIRGTCLPAQSNTARTVKRRDRYPPPHITLQSLHSPACQEHAPLSQGWVSAGLRSAAHSLLSTASPYDTHNTVRDWWPTPQLAEHRLHSPVVHSYTGHCSPRTRKGHSLRGQGL